ncbi:hypothetical protein F2P81_001405 [Scophthalmus maximus]|uniref:Par3/HAL N-terminal domain-containing protein n=1 Tax=Scophthalmus maximus TaxID=52904 RepID=A0A6A4TBA3_SCOMX|nr:hypothetical protein F2P81_001405 [Scophthalmus maximus]
MNTSAASGEEPRRAFVNRRPCKRRDVSQEAACRLVCRTDTDALKYSYCGERSFLESRRRRDSFRVPVSVCFVWVDHQRTKLGVTPGLRSVFPLPTFDTDSSAEDSVSPAGSTHRVASVKSNRGDEAAGLHLLLPRFGQLSIAYASSPPEHGDIGVKTHHLEYADGGILDMDDLLSDLVDDRDKAKRPRDGPQHVYTPLLVRSSSDSAVAPPHERMVTSTPEDRGNGSPEPEVNHVLKGALDRLRTDDPPAKMSKFNFRPSPVSSSKPHDKGIEANSRSKREKIFQEDECIVQINDTPLEDKTFAQ